MEKAGIDPTTAAPSQSDRLDGTLLLLLFAGTIFCEFLRFGKNRKIKYPQKFLPTYQAIWSGVHVSTITNCVMPNHSLLIVSAFSFLPSVLKRARQSDV